MATLRPIPEYTSPEEDLLTAKYYAANFQFQHILDSFDWFLEHDLDLCMRARKFTLTGGKFGYMRITRITQPTYEVGGQTFDLTPEIALLEDLTYAVRVYVVVVVENILGEPSSESNEFPLFLVPIPRYSGRCYYNWVVADLPAPSAEGTIDMGVPPTTRDRYGEKKSKIPPSSNTRRTKAPKNPGCDFIIAGTRNVVLLFEKGRFNQYSVHVDLDSPWRLLYLCLISEAPYATSSTYLYFDKAADQSLYIGVDLSRAVQVKGEDDSESDDDGDVDKTTRKETVSNKSKKNTRDASANVLCVAYALLAVKPKGEASLKTQDVEKRFVKRMREIIPKDVYSKCYSAFASTIIKYRELNVEQILDVLFSGTKISTKPGDGAQRQDGRFVDLWIYFRDQMFPNWTTADQKFEILVMCTTRLLLTHIGHTQITDRNHWATRSLHDPGPMLMGVFRRLLARMISSVQGVSKFPSVKTAEELAWFIKEYAPKLEAGFIHAFKPPNNKGIKGAVTKKPQGATQKAIAIDASPINIDEMRTILTKTRNSAFKENPSFRNRSVEGSFWKFLCSYYATEDDRCGLTKFLALMALVTTGFDGTALQIIEILLKQMFGDPPTTIVKREYEAGKYELPVTVDSLLIGFASKEYGYGNITLLKRYGIIPRKACIVLTQAGVLEIYIDPHRLMIPVVTCEDSGAPGGGADEPRIFQDPNWKSMSFEELLQEGYIEYMDNYEIENAAVNLAQTYASFHNYQVELNKWTTQLEEARKIYPRDFVYEKNLEEELRSLVNGKPNAMALHPLGSFSVTSAKLPFQHFNMPCRNAYATKMAGQEMMDMLDSPYEHTKGYISASKTLSSVGSQLPNIMGQEPDVGGNTVELAVITDPLNQEDACIINRGVIDRGAFRHNRVLVFRDTLEDKEEYGRLETGEFAPYIMRHIGKNGIPATGVRVRSGDCILSKYKKETSGGQTTRLSKILQLDRDEEGVITEVVTFNSVRAKDKAKKLSVSIKIVLYSRLERGDKVITRHGQKYTVAAIRNQEDMPWNERMTVQVSINPACFPTRMTTGTVLGPLLGLSAALGGRLTDIAGHREYDLAGIRETLHNAGYNSNGTQRLYLGTTGERVTAEIFVGPERVTKLGHLAAEKIQCRATGKQNKVNRQADASKYGETRNKGQKVGEPERNKLIQYGASFIVQDRMNLSCDGVTVVVCKVCSGYASYDPTMKAFSCSKCGLASLGETDSNKFGKYIMPQTARYTHALLASLGVVPKPQFVDRETYLNQSGSRDAGLDLAGEALEGEELDWQ